MDQITPLIKDTDIKTFAVDVIEQSKTKPVIVDFWADWCEPCKQLTPALEAAVSAAAGAVTMVKVDADKNQALCGQLQVQSLPTVFGFWQGQPVDGFQGMVPGSQIKEFIDRLIKLAGGGAEEDGGIGAALKEADSLMDAGQMKEAASLYQQIIGTEPGHLGAMIGLADLSIKISENEQAQQILDTLNEDALDDSDTSKAYKVRLDRIRTALDLAKSTEGAGDISELEGRIEANPQDHQARFDLSIAHQAGGDNASAAEALLGILMRDRDWNDKAAHERLLMLFEVAGPTDPFTLKYRRRLSSILFS